MSPKLLSTNNNQLQNSKIRERDNHDMGAMQMRASLQSSLLSSTDESTSTNHLDMNDSLEWTVSNNRPPQNHTNNKVLNSSTSDLLNSMNSDAMAISALILSPNPIVNNNNNNNNNTDNNHHNNNHHVPAAAHDNNDNNNNDHHQSYSNSSYMMDSSGIMNNDAELDFNNQHLQNTDSNLSFQSVGSTGSSGTYFSASFKPAILRQPSSALTSSSKKKRPTSRSSIDSIIQGISESKKKTEHHLASISSPMTKLIELAGLCEDRYVYHALYVY